VLPQHHNPNPKHSLLQHHQHHHHYTTAIKKTLDYIYKVSTTPINAMFYPLFSLGIGLGLGRCVFCRGGMSGVWITEEGVSVECMRARTRVQHLLSVNLDRFRGYVYLSRNPATAEPNPNATSSSSSSAPPRPVLQKPQNNGADIVRATNRDLDSGMCRVVSRPILISRFIRDGLVGLGSVWAGHRVYYGYTYSSAMGGCLGSTYVLRFYCATSTVFSASCFASRVARAKVECIPGTIYPSIFAEKNAYIELVLRNAVSILPSYFYASNYF
jgi:hypothetical protein